MDRDHAGVDSVSVKASEAIGAERLSRRLGVVFNIHMAMVPGRRAARRASPAPIAATDSAGSAVVVVDAVKPVIGDSRRSSTPTSGSPVRFDLCRTKGAQCQPRPLSEV